MVRKHFLNNVERKAFDKVPHMRLLVNLQSYGICSKTLDWIKVFLRVVVNGQRSEWSEVTSGIPQGSVLGPLLFVMFINDLPKTVQCGIKLFADDTKVYVRSDIPGNPDCLQNDITQLGHSVSNETFFGHFCTDPFRFCLDFVQL